MLKKRYHMLALMILLAIACLSAWLLFFADISEKRYNKIMCYYITRNVTRDAETFPEKIAVLRNFVHENIHPIPGYYNRGDTVAVEKLLSGIGWCDQQARVFMQLAAHRGITSRLLFLRLRNGGSPHSVAEALMPDGRWVIVDPMYDLDLINQKGQMASQADIASNPDIISENERVKLRSRFETRWAEKTYLSVYSNTPDYILTRHGIEPDLLKPVPISWLRPIINIIQNRYLNKARPELEKEYNFKFIKARGYQLLGYYEESDKLYKEMIESSRDIKDKYRAEFYYALSLKERKRYDDAYSYITTLIDSKNDNPYREYLYGLRAAILQKIGRPDEADKDMLKTGYSLE